MFMIALCEVTNDVIYYYESIFFLKCYFFQFENTYPNYDIKKFSVIFTKVYFKAVRAGGNKFDSICDCFCTIQGGDIELPTNLTFRCVGANEMTDMTVERTFVVNLYSKSIEFMILAYSGYECSWLGSCEAFTAMHVNSPLVRVSDLESQSRSIKENFNTLNVDLQLKCYGNGYQILGFFILKV